MKFIKVWSYSCAKYLSNQLKESHEKRGVYYYGFQVIIGAIVKAVILVSLSLILGTIIPALIILFVFGSLRVLAGGFHMDTYGKCIATSTVLFIGASMLSQYTYRYWNILQVYTLLFVTIAVGLFIVVRWAPRDTPNKPITKPEAIKKYKRQSIFYVIIWGGISIFLTCFGGIKNISYMNLIVTSASFGVLLELFTVTPLGYGFFHKISGQKR